MRAVVFDEFGGPEVLRVAEVDDPVPGPGEVRVRVRAAGVQPFDTMVRRGLMPWAEVRFPQTIGQEYAGIVDAVGPGAAFAIGDAVLGSTLMNGASELVCVPAETVVRKPDGVSFPVAGGLVAAAQTASGALRELAVTDGDVLLVHAAAGSVGTVAVQLALMAGATVVGTASPANHAHLRSLGVLPVAYGDGLVAAVHKLDVKVTVALDAAGGAAVDQSLELGIAPERVGTIVGQNARVVRAPRDPARLAAVVGLAGEGRIKFPVRTYPLDGVRDAHAAVETRHGLGKVVLLLG